MTIEITSRIGGDKLAKAGSVLDQVYPVGSIYLSVNSTNPGTILGGTWVAWGAGRVPVGVATSEPSFNTVEKTGGEIEHTLTASEMPSHTHQVRANKAAEDVFSAAPNSQTDPLDLNEGNVVRINWQHKASQGLRNVGTTGGDSAHNNLQPYITCYMWKRTA